LEAVFVEVGVMTTDFREVYKGVVGACASCRFARTVVKDAQGFPSQRPYKGGRAVACALGKHSGACVNDKPDLRFDANKCWVRP
jgi:hypothetical protein